MTKSEFFDRYIKGATDVDRVSGAIDRISNSEALQLFREYCASRESEVPEPMRAVVFGDFLTQRAWAKCNELLKDARAWPSLFDEFRNDASVPADAPRLFSKEPFEVLSDAEAVKVVNDGNTTVNHAHNFAVFLQPARHTLEAYLDDGAGVYVPVTVQQIVSLAREENDREYQAATPDEKKHKLYAALNKVSGVPLAELKAALLRAEPYL